MAAARDFFCPVDAGGAVLAGKWRPRLLWKLHTYGVVRYGQFKRELPDITDKMLAQQLRELERDGLVERTVYPVVPPRVEYRFTDFGRTLAPVIEALEAWSRAHEPRIRAALAAADEGTVAAGRGDAPVDATMPAPLRRTRPAAAPATRATEPGPRPPPTRAPPAHAG